MNTQGNPLVEKPADQLLPSELRVAIKPQLADRERELRVTALLDAERDNESTP